MSNKPLHKLNPIDRELRKARPVTGGNANYVKLRIEMVNGFELFNTRPYHNYETWSDGWRIVDEERQIVVSAEDLDDAVAAYVREVEKRNAEGAEQEEGRDSE